MKIKRYLEKDMRRVLRQVREDQGPDAVILSNRRVDGGIEVIAALDYDEALVRQALSPPSASASQTEDTNDAPDADAPEVIAADLSPEEDAETAAQALWSQEPTLVSMRSELASLRGLVEAQLSGLIWKEGVRRSPMRAQILRNLSRLGIAPDIANMVVNRLGPIEDVKQMWNAPLAELAQLLPVSDDQLIDEGGVVALIGPTGVGKTTTIAKIAARFAMRHGTDGIALISADAYRIGAQEHLTSFANIIGVKVHTAENPDDLTFILDRVRRKRLVLIDTEGMSQRDSKLSSRLAAFGRNEDRVGFYLVLSAANQESGLDETVRNFSQVPIAGSIVTKIDEAGQLGCIISALIRNDLPVGFVSNGQRIPDDLHPAAKKKLWLINYAVECMEASEPKINERTMAEQFATVSAANA